MNMKVLETRYQTLQTCTVLKPLDFPKCQMGDNKNTKSLKVGKKPKEKLHYFYMKKCEENSQLGLIPPTHLDNSKIFEIQSYLKNADPPLWDQI